MSFQPISDTFFAPAPELSRKSRLEHHQCLPLLKEVCGLDKAPRGLYHRVATDLRNTGREESIMEFARVSAQHSSPYTEVTNSAWTQPCFKNKCCVSVPIPSLSPGFAFKMFSLTSSLKGTEPKFSQDASFKLTFRICPLQFGAVFPSFGLEDAETL